jgi:hypothetical protein
VIDAVMLKAKIDASNMFYTPVILEEDTELVNWTCNMNHKS